MSSKARLDSKLLFILIFIVFLDICNFFMPVPVYTPLFLHHNFLPGVSPSTVMVLLGVLISCFGAAQLFGGPIFGELSDKFGRKKLLLIALITGMLGTLLAAISLSTGCVPLIYLSRLIIGFSSGTIGVSYAVAADLSAPEELAKNIGYISLGPCFASAVAPLIGGHLASNPHLAIFGFATPFYFLVLMFLFSTILLWRLMPTDAPKQPGARVHPLSAFSNIAKVIRRGPVFVRMVMMAIFFQLGTEGFFLATPILSVKEYHLSAAGIANHFFLFAIGSSFVTWLNARLSRHFESTHIYVVSLIIMLIGIAFAYSGIDVLFWLAFLLFGAGGMLCWVHTNNIFSSLVSESEQGLIMGVSQAMWSIGGLLSSLVIGLMASVHYQATGILLIGAELASLVMMLLVIKAMKIRRVAKAAAMTAIA